MHSAYAKKLATLAEAEFDRYSSFQETNPIMANRIKTYWASVGLPFPGVGTPWAAIFVSYFVKLAGATPAEFSFSAHHSIFVQRAIKNGKLGVGLFRGRRISEYSPKIGDVIQNNRGGNTFDFDYAENNLSYSSHTAIVVEEGIDGNGRYVRTISGNVSDSIGQRVVRLSKAGKIVQPKADPTLFICVIENLK